MKKLGFGFMRLPLKDKQDNKSIDTEQLNRMVDTFLERGFTYFDTAYMYHGFESEIALRESLVKRHPREAFQVATKMPTMFLKEEADLERIFNEQLKKTGVEYFDYYLLHNLNANTIGTAENLDAFSFIMKKKKEGKIRKAGFSFHDNAAVLERILSKHPDVDFVQLQINYLDWKSESIQSGRCYDLAVKYGIPVIVMEPVKGGNLVQLPEEAENLLKGHNPGMSTASWAIRYAASPDNVMMVLSGMSDYDQLIDNTDYMAEFKPLSVDEQKVIDDVVGIMKKSVSIPCTACLYCIDSCPVKIPIPNYFTLYNDEKRAKPQMFSLQKLYYSNYIKENAKASDCIECRKCEASCPQHIKIADLLKEVVKTFESTEAAK